jgi:hypothetical protein
MRTLGIIGACLLAIVIGGAVWFYVSFPTYSYRYRLTIDVDVGGETHSGSSVIEVKWQLWPEFAKHLFGGGIGSSRFYGQAVFVDLGPYGGLLAALQPVQIREEIPSVGADFLAIRAFNPGPLPHTGYPLTRDLLRRMSHLKERADLTENNLPQLIWLPKIQNPDLARPILAKDFPSTIAAQVRLRSARIETTNDALTTGLERKLPWLVDLQGKNREFKLVRPYEFELVPYYLLGVTS